ncbi:MAG: hypothetical protein BGO99_09350 [Nitrosospira sp. 56-18]|jgi:hypothetical protein|nr:MAG: hypothetical protein BGO99_09350 [Nitrosospira sp. 56-18]
MAVRFELEFAYATGSGQHDIFIAFDKARSANFRSWYLQGLDLYFTATGKSDIPYIGIDIYPLYVYGESCLKCFCFLVSTQEVNGVNL